MLARLAAALDAALARPLAIGGRLAVLGSRWGMAESGEADDAASLLRRAGKALVAAKASDGATVHVAGPEGAAPLDSLAIDLHLAIERGEIDVLFQPQAPIDGRHVTGVGRWRDGGTAGSARSVPMPCSPRRTAPIWASLCPIISRSWCWRASRAGRGR